MNIRITFPAAFLFMVVIATSCGEKRATTIETSEVSSIDAGHGDSGHEGDLVSLSSEQMSAIGLALSPLQQKDITSTVKVNGTLEVPAQNKASVTSLYSGIVQSIHVHPGSAVRKGQAIATIANTELTDIQQQLISVNAQLKLAELEHKRQQELVAGNAAPLKNLQRAQAELSSFRAQKAALAKHLATLGISASAVSAGNISSTLRITAPISGTISDIHAQIGSKVDATTPLAEIVNNSRLHLDLFVYEKDLPRVSEGQIIHFTLTNNPGKEYDARIYSIGTAFVNETKAVPVHAEVRGNKSGLIEGMSVTAIISIGNKVSPAVPTDAIVSREGKDFIFIQSDKAVPVHPDHAGEEGGSVAAKPKETFSTFERIEIGRGASDLGYTEIIPIEPLPDKALIVVKGAFYLLAKMTNKGGHDH